MPPLLLNPNEILSMSAQAADRLLESGDGDSALLYLALLRRGGDPAQALPALKWDPERLAAASRRLAALELIRDDQIPPAPAERVEDTPPDYRRVDVQAALDNEPEFKKLCGAVDECLGRFMSEADLRALYTIYDHIALPPEVILILTHWCVSETERRLGPGRRPRLSEIKKEAFRWKRDGVENAALAEAYMRRQESLSAGEGELLALLDIRGRPAVEREREYLSAWMGMGFHHDAIRLAYERTLFQKQKLNWAYMNSILKRWHQAGWHTAAQVEAKDAPAPRTDAPARTGPGTDFQPTSQRIRQNDDQLREFLKNQRKGG